MIKIETERLFLREYQKTDWEAVHSYGRQGDILIYEAWGPNTEADTKAFIEKAIIDSKVTPRMTFELAVVLKENNQLIGGCGFRIHKNNLEKGDFGYIIHPNFWNKGFATEASKALLEFMVKNKNITEIVATCDALNMASQKVLEKCGLKKMRIKRQDFEMKGRLRDTCFYAKKIEKVKENHKSLFKNPEQLWIDFVAENPSYQNAKMPLVEHYCDNEKDANALEQLTYDGTKTATCSLHAAYEMENESLPKVGNLSIITKFNGKARSILKIVKVSIRKFKDIDVVWARKEGEGDFSLDYWRKGHWAFFERETKNYGLVPNENMLLVCEEFERIN